MSNIRAPLAGFTGTVLPVFRRQWAYWVAPIVGAIVAAILYDRVMRERRVSI